MPTEQILKLVGFIIGNRDVVEAATVTRMVKLVRRRRAAWALPFIGLSPPFLELSLSFHRLSLGLHCLYRSGSAGCSSSRSSW